MHLASLPSVTHKTMILFRHLSLSFATPLTSSQDIQPATFLSFSIVLHQVAFGLPTFLFPSGVQVSAVAQWCCLGILSTCPIHFHLHFLISLLTLTELVLSISSFMEITYGQKNCYASLTCPQSQKIKPFNNNFNIKVTWLIRICF